MSGQAMKSTCTALLLSNIGLAAAVVFLALSNLRRRR